MVEKIRNFEIQNELGTTDINTFELYWGAYKSRYQEKEVASAKGVLNSLFLASTSEDVMETAAKLS
ncbi:MAG: hypothetical protein QXX95_05995 [Nitrososphaerales archaeon]